MVKDQDPAASASVADEPLDLRKRRGWERAAAPKSRSASVRATFQIDAQSPREEILAKHDAELAEEPFVEATELAETATNTVICF